MLAMKFKTLTSEAYDNPFQRSMQLRTDAVEFIRRIGPEKVVSICEQPDLSMITVWYREEG